MSAAAVSANTDALRAARNLSDLMEQTRQATRDAAHVRARLVRDLHHDGLSVREIARQLDLTTQRVYRILDQADRLDDVEPSTKGVS